MYTFAPSMTCLDYTRGGGRPVGAHIHEKSRSGGHGTEKIFGRLRRRSRNGATRQHIAATRRGKHARGTARRPTVAPKYPTLRGVHAQRPRAVARKSTSDTSD